MTTIPDHRTAKKQKAAYLTLSFLLPAILALLCSIALQIQPFGDRTLVVNDANAYYVPYLSYCKSIFQGNHDLFYSFSQDIGGGIAATIWPYLLNPFSWIISLAEYEVYPSAYTFGVILTTGLYGLSMYLLLADLHGHGTENLLISTCYALSGFVVCFTIYTAFFFSGPLFLPLMVLGLRKLVRAESPLLYILAIAYPIVLQIQMGFAICMAALLLFLAILFTEDHGNVRKELWLRFAAASLVGGFLGSIVWLPEMVVIRQGRGTLDIDDLLFKANGPLLQFGARLFTGANSVTQIAFGFPAVFCGILPLALVILYFMNPQVVKKRKLAYVVLLTVYVLGFAIRTFTSMYQGFTHANWFNYRFSFVFIFLTMLIAAEQLHRLDDISERDVKRCGTILLCFSILVFFTNYEFVDGGMVVLDMALLAAMGAAFLFHRKDPNRAPKNVLILALCLLSFFQLYLNYYFCTKSVFEEWSEAGEHYTEYLLKKEPMIRAAQNIDNEFFRIESEQELDKSIGNDSFFLDYNGVGFAGHTERWFVSLGLARLGINLSSSCWNSYDKGIPAATDTLLGIKYLLSERDLAEEKGYIRKVELMGLSMYENPYALPIAFVSEAGISDLSLSEGKNVFENLNSLWKAITGKERDIFTEETDISFSNHNPTDIYTVTHEDVMKLKEGSASQEESRESGLYGDMSSSSETAATVATTGENRNDENRYKPYVEFRFIAKQTGPIYLYDYASFIEGSGTLEDILQYVGYYREGDEVIGKLYLNYTVTEQVMIDTVKELHICYADCELLQEYAETVKARRCSLAKESDSHLSGDVEIQKGQRLLFTIPYDEGWKLNVDGILTPLTKTADLFMSADVQPGIHHYEMSFRPVGFSLGTVLSSVALLVLILQCTVKVKKDSEEKANEEVEK